jgi:5-methylcytosine-specific restriction endonuclease McrA
VGGQVCSTPDCGARVYAKGLCRRCYGREATKKRRKDPAKAEIDNARSRRWKERNPGANRRITRERRSTPEGREASRRASSEYAASPAGRESHRASAERRRARTSAGQEIDRATVWLRDNGICHICVLPVGRDEFHMDHVVSLDNGGVHAWGNVSPAHAECNLRKGSANFSGVPEVWERALVACLESRQTS